MDPAFEVAVAGKHRGCHQVALADAPADVLRQGAGVADTGGAAVADDIEAQLVQVGAESRPVQVVPHHEGARRQAGLYPGFHGQSSLSRFSGHQSGADHHRRVGSVGAGGNGCDDHRPVLQLVVGNRRLRNFVAPGHVRQVAAEAAPDFGQGDAVLGPFRSGEAGRYPAHVQFQGGGIVRLGTACCAPHALCLRVSFHQFHLFIIPAGQAQVVDGFPVDGEDAAGGAVFRGHIGDGRPVRQGQVVQAVSVEFDELADHTVFTQHFHHGQDQVRGRGALRQRAVEFETDHFGDEHGDGLPQHRRFRLDAAHAPAEHAQAVDHRGMGIGAHHGIRVGFEYAVCFPGEHRPGQVFQVDLVHDAGVRRHHLEIGERLLPPAQELVPLPVAFEFDGRVALRRVRRAEHVHHHRMVDNEFSG